MLVTGLTSMASGSQEKVLTRRTELWKLCQAHSRPSLFSSMAGLEVSLNLGTHSPHRTLRSCQPVRFAHRSTLGLKDTARFTHSTQPLSFHHSLMSHTQRGQRPGERELRGSQAPSAGRTRARSGGWAATEPRGSAMTGEHECSGLGSSGGFHSEGLQSWCVHSQHGGFGGALNEQIASTPCNHLRKTKGTNGEGQVRSHAAKA